MPSLWFHKFQIFGLRHKITCSSYQRKYDKWTKKPAQKKKDFLAFFPYDFLPWTISRKLVRYIPYMPPNVLRKCVFDRGNPCPHVWMLQRKINDRYFLHAESSVLIVHIYVHTVPTNCIVRERKTLSCAWAEVGKIRTNWY